MSQAVLALALRDEAEMTMTCMRCGEDKFLIGGMWPHEDGLVLCLASAPRWARHPA